jgi:hypothetical protein
MKKTKPTKIGMTKPTKIGIKKPYKDWDEK